MQMAYSAVISAMQIIERLQDLSRFRILSPNEATKPIYAGLYSLTSVLEKLGEMQGSKLRFGPLEQQVEDVAYQIEDLVESFILSEGFLSGSEAKQLLDGDVSNSTLSAFSQELFNFQLEIILLTEKLNKHREDYDNMEQKEKQGTADYDVLSCTIDGLDRGRKLVGLDNEKVQQLYDKARQRELYGSKMMSVERLDDDITKILDWVNDKGSSMLEIMAVVGSDSFGATIFNRVIQDPTIEVSEDIKLKGPFQYVEMLNCANCTTDGLCDIYRRYLVKKRYLIVLADVRNTQAWDHFRPFFPNLDNRSKIILTTMLPDVAKYICMSVPKHCKGQGLPLAIPAVGKHQHMAKETGEPVVSSRILNFNKANELVALDNEVIKVMQWIFNGSPRCQIMSIVGMVGLGKTTLVQQVYEHPLVQDYYECCFWVTIGPNCKLQEFMQHILEHRCFPTDEQPKNLKEAEFGEYFLKFLDGKRFLIVLDDIWSIEIWRDLIQSLPTMGNRCRIICTTRLLNVAHAIATATGEGRVYEKRFLNNEDSWNLLRRMVFNAPGVHCSCDLEKYGKKIAENCEGLPLVIRAVGKHLHLAEKTVEYWKKVSEQENLHDIIKDDYEDLSMRLLLSYRMLPRHLKELFLYTGIFPNEDISVAMLFKLWCAEGFFGLEGNKSFEDIAMGHLRNLVSQSVVFVREESFQMGRIKKCKVHFIFRYLCLDEAKKEKFCLVLKKYVDICQGGTNRQQRLCIRNNVLFAIKPAQTNMESIQNVHSLLCLGSPHHYPLRVHFKFKLLKILHALTIRFYEFPVQLLKLVRLKFLAITCDAKIPESISLLWNLEVLIVGRYQSIISSSAPSHFPVEIWNLKWLKHLQCKGIDLADHKGVGRLVHLISLSGVSARSCSRGVLSRLPNLKKLGILIELAPEDVQTFSFFHDVAQQLQKLQSFKCIVLGHSLGLDSRVIPDVAFHNSLTKITLSGCRFSWDYMATIGSLPHLEILKLRSYAFCGSKWETYWGSFLRLKLLLLEDLDIEEWTVQGDDSAYCSCFPYLERLMIRHCYKLRKISLGFNPTALGIMEFDDCSPTLESFARKTHEVFKFWGRSLQIFINYSWLEKKSWES